MAWDSAAIGGDHEDWFRLHDPVLRFARQLLVSDAVTSDDIARIDFEVTETIQAAKAFALCSPLPDTDSVYAHVLAGEG
jgi:TPP-dependent pyruvate/acetoin dehydrogenase alpha subunit